MTEYFNQERALSVRLSVRRPYVRPTVRANNFHTCQPILMKFGPHDLNKKLR